VNAPVTRRLKILVLIAALGAFASACSSATHAATVNGTAITDAEVLAVRSDDPGSAGEISDGDTFRSDLTTLIVTRASALAAADDYGLDDLDSEAARQAFLAVALPEELTIVNNVSANPALGSYAVEVVTTQLAIRRAVISAMAQDPGFLQSVWDGDRDRLVQVCVRHLVVETQDGAQAAKDRIDAGEDFGDVATDVSLDQQSVGGALPCPVNPARYVEPFSSVVAGEPVGEVTDPFETSFGWHVVVIDSRDEPQSYEEFAADPERWIPAELLVAEFNAWRDAIVSRADIVVRSQIGTWFPQADAIIAPAGSP